VINEDNLQFIPSAKFMRNCPVLFLKDCPLASEVEKEIGYSSQEAKKELEALQGAGIPRGAVHTSYCFNFRPDDGELSAIFWRKGLPVEGYVPWGEEKNSFILDYVFNELKRLRAEIQQSKPKFIICSGKWSLYFLTGLTTYKDTAKSSFGTLMKWRASSLQLSDWWDYPTDCIVMPILPLNSRFQLPSLQYLVQWDLKRIKKIGKAAMEGDVSRLMKRKENFYYPKEDKPELYFIYVKNVLMDLLHQAEHAVNFKIKLAIDVETMSYAYIDCIGIAWSNEDAICIPFATKDSPHYWEERQEVEIYYLLRKLLLHPNVQHIGQNYSYDMQYFWRNMLLAVAPEQDTMIMNHVLFSTMEKNLGFLSSLYCQIHKWWKDEGKTHKGATDIERWVYNCRDCCTTFEIAAQLEIIYEGSPESLQKALHFQTKEVLPAITKVMARGVKLDTITRDTQIIQLLTKAKRLEQEFQIPFEEPVNLNSPQQMKEIFYDLFRCKKVWKKVTDDNGVTKNTLTLDEETLKDLWETELLIRPFIDKLLDFKKLTKTASGLKALTLDIDGKLRCSYNICGTDTHRFSSNANAFGTGTNLQVISKGKKLRNGDYLPNSKKLFLPPPGMTFFDIDLAASDAWNVAAISVCHALLDILESGEDLYTMLAREYYHDLTITKSDDRRQKFKMVVHAGNYLGSAATIAARTGLLVVDVERILRYYFGRFPEVTMWQTDLKNLVRNKKKITNIFGFQRWFFDQSLPTLMQVAAAWAPQCTTSNVINTGMVRIQANPKLDEVEVLLQTHDSLAGQYPTGREDLKQGIESSCLVLLPYERPITIPVDLKTSEISWGHC
jgi:DNA polymerase I-like protein with 3'-5' exonuclease and polymerase domains